MGEIYFKKRPKIMSERETGMYAALQEAFPDHIINSQVAISQLVEVNKDFANHHTHFNKIARLVLDFVVTNKAHEVVACIELDDWTHQRRDRQDADRRKTEALAESGYLLLRFDDIPTKEEILEKLETAKSEKSSSRRDFEYEPHFSKPKQGIVGVGLFLAMLFVGLWGINSIVSGMAEKNAAMAAQAQAAAKEKMLKAALERQRIEMENARQQLAEAARLRNTQKHDPAPVEVPPSLNTDQLKEEAWNRFYKKSPECEYMNTNEIMVQCGNEYIRARAKFDKQWDENQTNGWKDLGDGVLVNFGLTKKKGDLTTAAIWNQDGKQLMDINCNSGSFWSENIQSWHRPQDHQSVSARVIRAVCGS